MTHVSALSPQDDPFGERPAGVMRKRVRVLGGEFIFESTSRRLLRLVDAAYAGLPAHRLSADRPRFHITLQYREEPGPSAGRQVPRMRLHAGAGLVVGTMDAANFTIVAPAVRAGLVAVSSDMLEHAYHTRYELIEFAVYALAARSQRLLALHGACVGHRGRGVLLIGKSGAGKSTVTLHSLLQGMEFLTEDSVFVSPSRLLATGNAAFLHLREDSLRFLNSKSDAAAIRRSTMIQRRSGVAKFEVDVRRIGYRIALKPLTIIGVVFMSERTASGRHSAADRLLTRLSRPEARTRLVSSQAYAAHQPGWSAFTKQLTRVAAYELRRGRHPDEAVEALWHLLKQEKPF